MTNWLWDKAVLLVSASYSRLILSGIVIEEKKAPEVRGSFYVQDERYAAVPWMARNGENCTSLIRLLLTCERPACLSSLGTTHQHHAQTIRMHEQILYALSRIRLDQHLASSNHMPGVKI